MRGLDGAAFGGDRISGIPINTTVVRRMIARLDEYPVFHAGDESVDFRVIYETTYPLIVDQLGNEEVHLAMRTWHEDGGITVGLRQFATVQSSETNADNTVTTVNYRVTNPPDGWSGGSDIGIALNPSALSAKNRERPSYGSTPLGSVRFARPEYVTATLRPGDKVEFSDETTTFEVTYESLTGSIDASSLDDGDIEKRATLFHPLMGSARFIEIVSTENDGRTVTARYAIDAPLDGWTAFGVRESMQLHIVGGSVVTTDGVPVADGEIGRVHFDLSTAKTLPLLSALDEWFKDLGDILGEDETVTTDSDHDNDGLEDIAEFLLGTDPLDRTDSVPMSLEIAAAHVQLSFRRRADTRDAGVVIEGSADGVAWQRIDDDFETVEASTPDNTGIRSFKIRSRASIENLPYRFFRMKVAPVQ